MALPPERRPLLGAAPQPRRFWLREARRQLKIARRVRRVHGAGAWFEDALELAAQYRAFAREASS